MSRAEGDVSGWTRWGGFLAISYAVICAGFQLMFVLSLVDVFAPTSVLLPVRLLIAFFGVQLLFLGNWKANCRRSGARDRTALRSARQMKRPVLRFEGWLLVSYGLIVIAGALFVPLPLIAPLFGSMSAASLVVVLIRRRQLREHRSRVSGGRAAFRQRGQNERLSLKFRRWICKPTDLCVAGRVCRMAPSCSLFWVTRRRCSTRFD